MTTSSLKNTPTDVGAITETDAQVAGQQSQSIPKTCEPYGIKELTVTTAASNDTNSEPPIDEPPDPGGSTAKPHGNSANEHAESEGRGGQLAASSTQVTATPSPSVLSLLDKFSCNSQLEEMKAQAKNAKYVAGRLALAGQITVLFGAPNTGKTAITLHLIGEALHSGAPDLLFFHINLDDTFEGLIQKAELGERLGYRVMGPNTFTEPGKNFAQLVDMLIEEGSASKAVFILDTVKKFTDVMDKRASTHFMNKCRQLASNGGTLILLAHTNKHPNADGASIPAGTNDLLEDCDAAYVLDLFAEERVQDGRKRTVEFRCIKARGPSTDSAMYSYVRYDDGDYFRLFRSVELVDGTEADRAREQAARALQQQESQDMIAAVSALLQGQPGMKQGDIIDTLTASHGFSRRKLTACLHQWSVESDPDRLWQLTRGDNNSRVYSLLP